MLNTSQGGLILHHYLIMLMFIGLYIDVLVFRFKGSSYIKKYEGK